MGAMFAAMLAMGYHPDEASILMDQELPHVTLDHGYGYLSLIPNIIRGYGWNPGEKLLEWFGAKFEAKTGNKDITFKELFDKFGKELCVVICNVNRMDAEYCHMKTTPNMPVRLAVRMSMSIPGVFKAVELKNGDNIDTCVDGGVLANLPLHCYDGWWLSMKKEDSFLARIQPLKDLFKLWKQEERFGKHNPRTLGVLTYCDTDPELYEELMTAGESMHVERPDTKLARKKTESEQETEKIEGEFTKIATAFSKFLQAIDENDLDKSATVDKGEMKKLLSDSKTFTKEDAKLLFGDDYTFEHVFADLDRNHDGKIDMVELLQFAERRGIDLYSNFISYDRVAISNVGEFISTLITTMTVNLKRLHYTKKDIGRTIAIDVDYLGTLDVDMESGDKEFAIKQGAASTRNFLQRYIKKNKLSTKLVTQ
uniref:Uncharacterized protein LOC102806773 n=1 Tax=Saccoglossus kowalevskii TaxID=10224 RepID=A0ABM0M3G9_SACKO|nr:PREDICTED: uncharacterized protein LOC102806773 [Saccoglossus kowalevskii]